MDSVIVQKSVEAATASMGASGVVFQIGHTVYLDPWLMLFGLIGYSVALTLNLFRPDRAREDLGYMLAGLPISMVLALLGSSSITGLIQLKYELVVSPYIMASLMGYPGILLGEVLAKISRSLREMTPKNIWSLLLKLISHLTGLGKNNG